MNNDEQDQKLQDTPKAATELSEALNVDEAIEKTEGEGDSKTESDAPETQAKFIDRNPNWTEKGIPPRQ